MSFSRNSRVVVKNLTKSPQYNGEIGVVVGDINEDRWPVQLCRIGVTLKVKPENLELVEAQKSAASPQTSKQPKGVPTPHELGADRWSPGSLDPSKLLEWTGSLEKAFINFQFSIHERMVSQVGASPMPGENLIYDMKVTLLRLTSLVDSGKRATLLLESESKTEGVAIRVVSAHACDGGAEDARPLLVVHYWSDRIGDPGRDRRVRGLESALQGDDDIKKTTLPDAGIAALRALLAYNAERLDPAWAASQAAAVPAAFALSYLTPLSQPTAATERPDCACGAKAPKLKCRRCGLKWYCSKECQVRVGPPIHTPSSCAAPPRRLRALCCSRAAPLSGRRSRTHASVRVRTPRVRCAGAGTR